MSSFRYIERSRRRLPLAVKVANLDFEARVPVPFSIFPSSYRETETATTQTHTHEELEIKLPQPAGREGQHSSFQAQASLPARAEGRFSEEEVHITREEERYRRPGIRQEFYREEHHKPQSSYAESRIEIDRSHRPHNTAIDVAEREYRSRFQPNYRDEVKVGSTVDGFRSNHKESIHFDETTVDVPAPRSVFKQSTYVDNTTVDAPRHTPVYKESVRVSESTVDVPAPRSTFTKVSKIVEETVDTPRYATPQPKSKMGYYDEDGHDRVELGEVRETRRTRVSVAAEEPSYKPNTVTIPCHHIRLGDILILQGRPCQVIRISTSAATGQHRYLGVDLFTKQLHEESSFVSNPAPSVVVQTMLGPVFKQYRVLDMQDGTIVAMTETGDVKQNLSVIDQSSLWSRLQKAFESGRGSVRVLVVSDQGREMAVDMKVVHGSRL